MFGFELQKNMRASSTCLLEKIQNTTVSPNNREKCVLSGQVNIKLDPDIWQDALTANVNAGRE